LDILSQIFQPILLFVLTLVTGWRLSRAGQPYNGVFFNTHKLLALGVVVISVIRLYRMPGGTPPQALFMGLLILAAVCAAALFASGALMSAGKADHRLQLAVHRIAVAGLVLASALAIYLLESGLTLQ
jgi:hypothetical protein